MGEDWVEVERHSLTEEGIIEEYYVRHTWLNNGESVTIQAEDITESHGGEHEHEAKPKKKKEKPT